MQRTFYAKYGVTDGMLETFGSLRFRCSILCSGWPGWAISAKIRGWVVELMVVKDTEWMDCFRCWFPDSVIVSFADCEKWTSLGVNSDVWLSDADPPRKLSLWDTNARMIITRRRARHLPKGSDWVMTVRSIDHVSCGGVTDGSWTFYFYSRRNDPPLLNFERVGARDLSTIFDSKLQGIPCPQPTTIVASHPRVIQIRPHTFHGGGLLPWTGRHEFVVAPCIFSPTHWVRRRVHGREMLKILDVPDSICEVLTSSQIALLCQDLQMVPTKVLCSLLDAIPNFTTGNPEVATEIVKKPKLEIDGCHLPAEPIRRADSKPSDRLEAPAPSDERITSGLEELTKAAELMLTEDRNTKATKSDDAAVPTYLWDLAIFPNPSEDQRRALSVLRKGCLRWWKRNIYRSFARWFHDTYKGCVNFRPQAAEGKLSEDAEKSLVAGRECITRSCLATWWEWAGGSRPYFWRWPADYRNQIRDGIKLWIPSQLPKWQVPQRHESDAATREKVRTKLVVVRGRGYIAPGLVKALTAFFSVKKGETDIRVVYDGTKSGLNAALWAPWFPLPTIEGHLRAVESGYYMGDIDIGEMFLNFILDESIQQYAGVDLTPYFSDEVVDRKLKVLWERWTRCAMGFKPSPYQAVQGVLIADEEIRGDHLDPANIFRWDYIRLNLPGSAVYEPSRPWVMKIRAADDSVAADFFIYVDDVRTSGQTYLECRGSSRRVGSMLNWLGLQDAARKRRDPSQQAGAWAGSIVHTDNDEVTLSVSVKRWEKAKVILRWIRDQMSLGPTIPFKQLESFRGFLIYLCRTYPAINPFLKGIHLTLDSWRPWRSDDGWKLTMAEIREALDMDHHPDFSADTGVRAGEKPPPSVTGVPRLKDDLEALEELFSIELPPKRPVRPSRLAVAVYQFGDASGTGFGSSLCIDGVIYYRHGQWSADHSAESSNFRELANLIYAIEDSHSKGLLDNTELFVFTDNTTAESAFYKGTSPSRRLFELIIRMQKLQMHGNILLHVIHVAGTRMIAQGTDALSRGLTVEGVMKGAPFGSFVPLHLSVLDRDTSGYIRPWVESWFSATAEVKWLSPHDWFITGHKHPACIWTPPPAAADAALEQLGQSVHKRPHHTHLVLIPRLMTSRWRKLLGKICDLVFTLPVGTSAWELTQYEPLIVGVCLPLCSHRPWKLRGTPMLARLERQLRDVPQTAPEWGRHLLQEFLFQARALDSMPSSMVRGLLHADGSERVSRG